MQPNQPQPKLSKDEQKAKKKQQQEQAEREKQAKIKELELGHIINTFNRRLREEITDLPTIYRMAMNALKDLVKADHVTLALAGEQPDLFLVKMESDLPKPVPGKPPDPAQVGIKSALNFEISVVEGSLVPSIVKSRQPVVIPDVSKFPEEGVQKWAAAWNMKSLFLAPLVTNDQVQGMVSIYTVNGFRAFLPVEIVYCQKLVGAVAKAIENAPPTLPEDLKGIIKKLAKAPPSSGHVDNFNRMYRQAFQVIASDQEERIEAIDQVLERDGDPLLVLWYQLAAMSALEGETAAYMRALVEEQYRQTVLHVRKHREEGLKLPPGFKDMLKFVERFPSIKLESLLPEEPLEELTEKLEEAVEAGHLISQGALIADIEQGEMLPEFLSIPATLDLRREIKSQIDVADTPSGMDSERLLDGLTLRAISEIAKVASREMGEAALFQIPSFLELEPDQQEGKIEQLSLALYRRFMGNLAGAVFGQPNAWGREVIEALKEKGQEATKQRKILVGKMARQEEEEEDED